MKNRMGQKYLYKPKKEKRTIRNKQKNQSDNKREIVHMNKEKN